MYRLLTLFCLTLPIAALAGPMNCKDLGLGPDGFTGQEWDMVGKNSPSTDPVIIESQFIFHKAQAPISASDKHRATPLDWPKAKKLILLGAVARIFEDYPGKSIYLAARSGRIYVTKIVGPDRLADVTAQVDPCHLYISTSTP